MILFIEKIQKKKKKEQHITNISVMSHYFTDSIISNVYKYVKHEVSNCSAKKKTKPDINTSKIINCSQ